MLFGIHKIHRVYTIFVLKVITKTDTYPKINLTELYLRIQQQLSSPFLFTRFGVFFNIILDARAWFAVYRALKTMSCMQVLFINRWY